MNILVSGCLGHIGSKLINELSKNKSFKIYGVDSNNSNNLNVIYNLKKKNFNFFLEDLIDFDFKKKIKKKIDLIIHLASTTNAEKSISNKQSYKKNNLGCFDAILKIAKYYDSKLIHISSTSVYGISSKLVDETLIAKYLKPQSPYAEIKLQEENILKKENINFISLRFGTIVGTSVGMRFHTAVNKFCLNAVFDKDIPVWSSAYNQYRPYLSLTDAIKVLIFLAKYKKNFDRGIYNVVTKNYKVKEIIQILKKHLNKKIKIKYINSKIMNQLSYKVSSQKIVKLGYKFKANISLDIKEIIKYLK
jgi:UDP-glucose 4-epimerase